MTHHNDNLDNQNQDPAIIADNSDTGAKAPKDELTKERWQQQMEGSKQQATKLEAQILEMAVQNVESNSEYIKTLYEKDPNLANKVATHFQGDDGKSYETADQIIKTLSGDFNQPEKSLADQVTEKVLAQLGQQNINSKIDSKFSHLGEEQKNSALEQFNVMKGDRQLTQAEANQLADMITLYQQKDTLIESAKGNNINSYGSLNLGGIANTTSVDENSGKALAESLGIKGLY